MRSHTDRLRREPIVVQERGLTRARGVRRTGIGRIRCRTVTAAADEPLRLTDRWFIRRGLPLLVEGYSSERDIWTRAQPLMIVILVVELLPFVLNPLLPGGSFRGLYAGLAAIAALILLGIWSKVTRGYWLRPPNRVGRTFVIFFLIAPVLAALISLNLDLGDGSPLSWTDVVIALVTQAAMLVVIYLWTRYAVFSITWWACRQTVRHFGDLYAVATKALPLLLIVMIVLFINTEVWQVAGGLDALRLWAGVGMLLLLGALVTLDRTRAQIQSLQYDAPRDQVQQACQRTPMQEVAESVVLDDAPVELTRRQRGNLVVAAMATQVIHAALIGAVVWAFFMVFGVVAISVQVQGAWLQDLAPQEIIWAIGPDHAVTRALFRVATFMGGFSAFYTTIYAATDDTYRRSFATDIGSELQRAVNVHRAYLACLNRQQAPATN